MNIFIVGIDFSKKSVDASLVQKEQPEKCIAYAQFSNDVKGVDKLVKWAKKQCKEENSQILFCGENTGSYSALYSDELTQRGFTMWIEHAMQIKRCSGDVRGKDDKIDSLRIATYAARFFDKMEPYVRPQDETRILKDLLKKRDELKSYLKGFSVSVKENPLRTTGEAFIGEVNDVYAEIIKNLKEKIKKIEKLIRKIISKSKEYKQNYDILTSMKGIGLINAIALIVYTDNFRKFNFNHRKIATYWGVVPFKNESGSSVRKGTHVSPKCNSWLKALLTEAALCAIRYNPKISGYYNRLITRGKSLGVALNNCKNKMLKILVAMVRTSNTFEEDFETKNHQMEQTVQLETA